MTFGCRLNTLRKSKNLTAQAMADILGISIRTYRFYESDRSEPPYKRLIEIADVFNVSLDYLLCRDDFLLKHVDES